MPLTASAGHAAGQSGAGGGVELPGATRIRPVTAEDATIELEKALNALTERGEIVAVSPTVQEVSPTRLYELANEVRGRLRPDAEISLLDDRLTYKLGRSP